MQIRNLNTIHSIYSKNLRNLANTNPKVSFTSILQNKHQEDDFSEEYKTDRCQAAFALIFTYLLIGGAMLFLVKSCSNNTNTQSSKSHIQAEEKVNK